MSKPIPSSHGHEQRYRQQDEVDRDIALFIQPVMDRRGQQHDDGKTEGGDGRQDWKCLDPPGQDKPNRTQYFANSDESDGAFRKSDNACLSAGDQLLFG